MLARGNLPYCIDPPTNKIITKIDLGMAACGIPGIGLGWVRVSGHSIEEEPCDWQRSRDNPRQMPTAGDELLDAFSRSGRCGSGRT